VLLLFVVHSVRVLLLLLLSRRSLFLRCYMLGDFRSFTVLFLSLSLSLVQKEKSKGSIEKGVASAFVCLFVCVCMYVCSELFQYSARARVKNGLSFACACLKFFSLWRLILSLTSAECKNRARVGPLFCFSGFSAQKTALSRVKLIFSSSSSSPSKFQGKIFQITCAHCFLFPSSSSLLPARADSNERRQQSQREYTYKETRDRR
jgi:hypothetical protein